MRLTPADQLCIPVPLYHCFGMVIGNLACTTHGACDGVSRGRIRSARRACRPSQSRALHRRCYGVPTMFIAELDHPDFARFDLSSLRTGIMAGAPCPMEVMRRVNKRDAS